MASPPANPLTGFGDLQIPDYIDITSRGIYDATASMPSDRDNSKDAAVKPRKPRAQTLREADWEPHKARIIELHISDKRPLKEVKQILESETGFCAEVRQYRLRITQWKLDKNIKPAEMQAIVRKKQERKLVEVGKPGYTFRVRGTAVDPVKIDRWMSRHSVPESMLYALSPDAPTPSVLDYHTILERGTPAILSPSFSLLSLPSPIDKASTPDSVFEYRTTLIDSTTAQTMSNAIWSVWDSYHSVNDTALSGRSSLDEDLAHCKTMTQLAHETILGTEGINVSFNAWNLLFFIPSRMLRSIKESVLDALVGGYWLSIGMKLEYRDECGLTPLLFAAQQTYTGYLAYLNILIRRGANIHAVDASGRGPLHLSLATCDKLYDTSADKPYARANMFEIIRTLLHNGCNPCALDDMGRIPSVYGEARAEPTIDSL